MTLPTSSVSAAGPRAGLTSVVFRYVVPVDGDWHTFELSGPIVHVGSRINGEVEFWAMLHHRDGLTQSWSFRVYGTGHTLDVGAEYVGTTYDGATNALVWHLFRKPAAAVDDSAKLTS
jgi:hypothetical protein